MLNISSFLEKFSKGIVLHNTYKKQIVDIIEEYTQIDIPTKHLEIKNGVVMVKASPGIKNKIFIYKKKILEDIAKVLPPKIVDIR